MEVSCWYQSLKFMNLDFLLIAIGTDNRASSRLRIHNLNQELRRSYSCKVISLFNRGDNFRNKIKRLIKSYLNIFKLSWISKNIIVQESIMSFYFIFFICKFLKFKKTNIFFDFSDPIDIRNSKYLNKFLFDKIIELADFLIFESPCYLKKIKKLRKKDYFLLLGPSNFKKNSLITKKKFNIGWIGTPNKYEKAKNILQDINLKVTNNNKGNNDISVLIVGASFREKSSTKNIKFLKWSRENEKFFLDQVDLGLYIGNEQDLNKFHGCGKLSEYMNAGIPTIAIWSLSAEYYIKKYKSGIYTRDKNEFFSTIITLLSNLELKNQLSNNAFSNGKKYANIKSYFKYIVDMANLKKE